MRAQGACADSLVADSQERAGSLCQHCWSRICKKRQGVGGPARPVTNLQAGSRGRWSRICKASGIKDEARRGVRRPGRSDEGDVAADDDGGSRRAARRRGGIRFLFLVKVLYGFGPHRWLHSSNALPSEVARSGTCSRQCPKHFSKLRPIIYENLAQTP